MKNLIIAFLLITGGCTGKVQYSVDSIDDVEVSTPLDATKEVIAKDDIKFYSISELEYEHYGFIYDDFQCEIVDCRATCGE